MLIWASPEAEQELFSDEVKERSTGEWGSETRKGRSLKTASVNKTATFISHHIHSFIVSTGKNAIQWSSRNRHRVDQAGPFMLFTIEWILFLILWKVAERL